MPRSQAKRIALGFVALTAIHTHTAFAEGQTEIEGTPLVTSLEVGESGAQLVTVFDIGEGVGVFEGDILVSLAAGAGSRSSTVQAQSFSIPSLSGRLWPNGTLHYAIDSELSDNTKSRILAAIEHWNTRTPIRIEPRSNQTDYVRFIVAEGCASYVGRFGGEQEIHSGPYCSKGNFIHEIGHTLGLHHEHTRPDRDTYVTIHESNIQSGKELNFNITDENAQRNTSYDYGSIMHYGSHFFSTTGEATIVPKQAGVTIGQRTALSNDDIRGISALYSSSFSVGLELSPQRPMPGLGSTITATIELQNITGSAVESLSASTTLPASVSFQQLNNSTGWSCSSVLQDLICTGPPSLQHGASTHIEVQMLAPSSASALNYSFSFSAERSGVALSNDAVRTLTMTTVNDPPTISLDPLTVIVPINDISAPVARIQADDLNGHTLRAYTITSQSHPGMFQVDADNGDIYATDSSSLNDLNGQTAQVHVTVSDGFADSPTTPVEINMLTTGALNNSLSSGAGGGVFMSFGLLLLLPLRRLRRKAAIITEG